MAGRIAFSAAFYVEQKQGPAGYGIRLSLPDRRTADIHVSAEAAVFSSAAGGKSDLNPGTFGPVFMQFASFSQRLTLPLDADIGQMRLTNRGGVIEIFIPKRVE